MDSRIRVPEDPLRMYLDPDPECHEEGWGTARSMAVATALVVAFSGAYVSQYGVEQYLGYVDRLGPAGPVLQFGVLAGILVAHEAIHALAYLAVGDLDWNEIEVTIGVDVDSPLDPIDHSVHPSRPVRRRTFLAGVAAPGVVLGVVPATVALATGESLAMFVGVAGLFLVATDVGSLVDAWRTPEAIVVAETT